MKKSKKRLTFATVAAGAALAASLSACHLTGQNPAETEYGPLPGSTYDPAEEVMEEIYGPPSRLMHEPAEEETEEIRAYLAFNDTAGNGTI